MVLKPLILLLVVRLEQGVLGILDIQTIVIVAFLVYGGNLATREHAKGERVQPAGYSTMTITVVMRKTWHYKTNSMVIFVLLLQFY
jgi:hypothetical protein